MSGSRRAFLKKSVPGIAALSVIPDILHAHYPESGSRSGNLIKQDGIILFQGDSITDSGREKEQQLPNNARSFGNGYSFLAASALLSRLPEKNLTIFNRGISGNKVYQLAERWKRDAIDLRPDLLSILIGVNDFWHTLQKVYDGTVSVYENDYRKLLQGTLQQLPDVRLVIGEPFALFGGSAVNSSWIPGFEAYRHTARNIATEFNAIFIPFQEIFNSALHHAPVSYWAPDGVHPSMAGAQLMASAWIRAVEG
jgi:lysophospholipase L1-like esterase